MREIIMKDKNGNIKKFGQELDAYAAYESGYYTYVVEENIPETVKKEEPAKIDFTELMGLPPEIKVAPELQKPSPKKTGRPAK